MKNIKEEIKQILKKSNLLKIDKIENTLEIPPQVEFGDFSSNICFALSRELKKSP